MLNASDIKELAHRASEVESLLTDRKYEDILYHLSYFEILDVSLQTLQLTDIIRIVYRVLKSCSQGALKKKAKCLLSKWKLLYKENCVHSKVPEENSAGDVKESSDNEIITTLQQANCDVSSTDLHSSADNQELAAGDINSSTEAACSKTLFIAEDVRVKCRELLCQALSDLAECQEKTNTYAKGVEESIYNMYAGNDKRYRNCIRSKVSNLRNPKNSHLKQQIYNGALSAETFAGMTAMEMASDDLRKLRDSYTQAGVQEHQLPQGVDGPQTSKVKCRKCEKFNCTVTMVSRGTLFLPGWVRTGNPDEEMMTFVVCNECGEKWYHSRWICL